METVSQSVPSEPKKKTKKPEPKKASKKVGASPATRSKLPDERKAVTHKVVIGGHKVYITVGVYEDGTPGELFITMSKEGSTVRGLMDTIATLVSISLQHGVPLRCIVDKMMHTRFEPCGYTDNKDIAFAKSVTDYIAKWLGIKFLGDKPSDIKAPPSLSNGVKPTFVVQSDAPTCVTCGSIMVRNGTCYRCQNCGGTSGCS